MTLFGDVVCSDARLGIWGPGIGDITIRYQGCQIKDMTSGLQLGRKQPRYSVTAHATFNKG